MATCVNEGDHEEGSGDPSEGTVVLEDGGGAVSEIKYLQSKFIVVQSSDAPT